MTPCVQSNTFRRILLCSVSLIAFSVLATGVRSAFAAGDDANATTDTNPGATVNASDPNGLLNDNSSTHTITIDSNGGPITLGTQDVTDAITFTSTIASRTAIYNITHSGANNGVTFAGDLETEGDENLILNTTNTTTVFTGDVQLDIGSAALNIGAGSSTLSTTFDTAVAANNSIDMSINTSAAADIITLNVTNSDGTSGNQITFLQAIGGGSATTAIDTLNIQSGAKATFDETVRAGNISINTTETITFNNTVTGDINLNTDNTISLGDGGSISGNADNLTGGDNAGTLDFADQTSGPVEVVTGTIGATNSLKAINTNSTSNTIAFGDNVNATTITLTGVGDTDETAFQGDVTGAIVIDTAGLVTLSGDKNITGSISTNTNGQGLVTFDTATANIELVSGAVGTDGGNALKQVMVNTGAGFTSSFGSTVNSATININGTGTTSFSEDVTSSNKLNFTGDATVLISSNKKIAGNVDASSNQGTLRFSTTTANTTLVSGAVGTTNALSAIETTVASGITATFTGTVNTTTLSNNGTGTLAASEDVTGNINLSAGGTFSIAASKALTGNIDNTSGADGSGILSIGAVGGNLTVISGTIGATNSLAQVTINTTGGEAAFSGAVKVVNFTATGSGTTALNGGGTITNLTASGDVTSGSSLLDLNGTMAMSGSDLIIGTGDATLSGSVITAANITLASGKDITFDGAVAQSVTALIDGGGAVTIDNSQTVTFQNALGSNAQLGAITVGSNRIAKLKNTVSAASLNVTGEIQLENTITVAGALNLNAATLTIGSSFTPGDTIFIVNDVVTSGTTTLDVSTDLGAGTYKLFDSTVDATTDIANIDAGSSILLSRELVANGTDVDLVVANRTVASIQSELGVTASEASILLIAGDAIATGNDTLLANLRSAVNTGGTTAAKAVKSLSIQRENMDAIVNIGTNLGVQVFRLTSDRLSAIRNTSTASASVVTDSKMLDTPAAKNSAWLKAFGSLADQRNTSSNESYDANTAGTTFGYDFKLSDYSRLGASFTYAYSDVQGGGAGESSSQIDSYQASVYGDYTKNQYFIEGSLGFAFNSVDTSRTIDFLGTDTIASAAYNSQQIMAAVQAGTELKYGTAIVTPTAGLSYIHLMTDEYTETGAAGLNQQVDIKNMNILLGTIGAKVHTQLKMNGGYLIPEIRGGISFDFIGDSSVATAQFTGGGAAFTVEGQNPERLGANIGFGIDYDQGDWIIGAGYDADIKNNYLSHSAQVKARLRF